MQVQMVNSKQVLTTFLRLTKPLDPTSYMHMASWFKRNLMNDGNGGKDLAAIKTEKKGEVWIFVGSFRWKNDAFANERSLPYCSATHANDGNIEDLLFSQNNRSRTQSSARNVARRLNICRSSVQELQKGKLE